MEEFDIDRFEYLPHSEVLATSGGVGGGYDTSLDVHMQNASQYACDRGLFASVVDMISHMACYTRKSVYIHQRYRRILAFRVVERMLDRLLVVFK